MIRLCSFLALCLGLMAGGCSGDSEIKRLKGLAAEIDAVFVEARLGVEELRDAAAQRFASFDPADYPPDGDDERFRYFEDIAYYKAADDGGCGVFASGFTPVGRRQRATVRMLETLEGRVMQLVHKQQFVDQAYLLTSEHIALFYPYLDAAAIFEPLTDFSVAYKPYYEAGPKHNPERAPVWVEPYVDATGKGYVVSVSAPVYAEGGFAAAAGSDLRTAPVGEAFLDQSPRRLMLVGRDGLVVHVNEALEKEAGLSGLGRLFYLEVVKTDVFAPDSKRLTHSDDPALRELASSLPGQESFELTLEGTKYRVLRAEIRELGWYLVQFVRQ